MRRLRASRSYSSALRRRQSAVERQNAAHEIWKRDGSAATLVFVAAQHALVEEVARDVGVIGVEQLDRV